MADHGLDHTTDCVFIDPTALQGHVSEHGLTTSDLESDRDAETEPHPKRLKIDTGENTFTETITIDWNDDDVKQTLYNVNRALTLRLEDLENKYESLLKTVQTLKNKVAKEDKVHSVKGRGNPVVVGLPSAGGSGGLQTLSAPGGNVTFLTLNSEADFPNGAWLGDETNPEMRVRVEITPSDLLHIHSNCRTPEKMALTLLDYLFDRDTQATSNLSGTGKHGKKQLDPLKIYGIRCHLMHRFAITDHDWHRIRLNLDSKCRTAYRRKVKGQPLAVKGFRDQRPVTEYLNYPNSSIDINDEKQLRIQENLSVDTSGELQIIHATEEQLAELQQSHQIQILEDNQVSAELLQQLQQQAGSGEPVHITVSTDQNESEHYGTDANSVLQVFTNHQD